MKNIFRRIGAAIVTLFLSLSFVVPTFAQEGLPGSSEANPYEISGGRENDNPFPDKVSDTLIQTYNRPSKYEVDNMIVRGEMEFKDGSILPLGDPNSGINDAAWEEFSTTPLETYGKMPTRIHWYVVFEPSKSHNMSFGLGVWTYVEQQENKLNLGSGDKVVSKQAKNKDIYLNGEKLDDSQVLFHINSISQPQYLSWTLDITDKPYSFLQSFTFGHDATWFGIYGSADKQRLFMYWSSVSPRANFHYVDEMEYRKLNGLSGSDSILQRSNGENWQSTVPGTALQLEDMMDPVQTKGEFRALRPNADPYFSLEEGTTKPTYATVIEKSPLGFTYIADDIDKPENVTDSESYKPLTEAGNGNYYLTPVLYEDGTYGLDKHYYILERQMPSPIKIHKTDDQDQGLKDVTFDLYRINGETETPVAS
ncbi:hypothetical protein, partial [Faecalicoccus sp.]